MKNKVISIVLVFSFIFCIMVSGISTVNAAGNKLPFTDVPEGKWFYEYVDSVYTLSLMKGTSDTIFEPNTSMTRAMFVTALGRLDGVEDDSNEFSDTFSDTKKDSYYSTYVGWAAENKIVEGFPGNTFRPNDPLSREQMVTIVSRYVDYAGISLFDAQYQSRALVDASSVAEWAKSHMYRLKVAGIVQGDNAGYFHPKNNLTRAETAKILTKVYEAILDNEMLSSKADETLLTAVSNIEYTAPKNVIFMIGDGMGFASLQSTEVIHSNLLYNEKLAVNSLPVQSQQSTYSASSSVTDSAAGGTALATGYKTANGIVAMTPDKSGSYKTTLELAAELGKSTGIIATKSVTDATPASFTAHARDRGYEYDIANQQIQKIIDGDLDLVMGGGYSRYETKDNMPLLQSAIQNGLTYTKSWADTANAKLPFVGLYSDDTLDTYDWSLPTIAEMTESALNLLDGSSENGFFLMIEGSKIDSASHSKDLSFMTHEVLLFDQAITVAMKYVVEHPDTILIITADHETGGIQLPENLTKDNISKIKYTTGGHTGVDVPVFAMGYGTEALNGQNDNTDLAKFVAKSMGVEDFGDPNLTKSVEQAKASFDISSQNTEIYLTAFKALPSVINPIKK